MQPVKMGVLSVSGHYRLRLQLPVRATSAVEMVAIASRSTERAEAAASEFGIPRSYGSYEQLLQDDEIEAVYIPLPNTMHAQWIKACADAGKHILCEKPIAMNAAEAEESLTYAQSKGVRVMEAFMFALQPRWQRVREMVAIGEIGPIQSIHTVFCYSNTDPKNIRNRADVGGGAIYDVGCYAVASSRLVMGIEPKRVISLVQRDPGFQTDAVSSAILDYGTTRTVFTVGTQMFPDQRVDIHGTGGRISVPMPFNTYPDVPSELTVTSGLGSRVLRWESVDQYGILFEQFARAIRGEIEPPLTVAWSVGNMRVLDALFRSEKSGRWEVVDGR